MFYIVLFEYNSPPTQEKRRHFRGMLAHGRNMKQKPIDMFFSTIQKPVQAPEPAQQRVITDADFEFYSSTDSDTDTSSEFAGDSTPSSPKPELREETIHTRHSELALAFQPVLTPDWHASDDDEKQDKVVDFDQESVHSMLEVLEHRIQVGDDEVHEHPGMAVSVLANEGVGTVSRKEQRLRENYVTIEERPIVPTFWPRRVYDRPCDLLTANESDDLAAAIEALGTESFTSSMITRRRSWHPHETQRPTELPPKTVRAEPKPERKRNRRKVDTESSDEFVVSDDDEVGESQRPVMETRSHKKIVEDEPKKVKSMILRMSSKYFETDESDEETDVECF